MENQVNTQPQYESSKSTLPNSTAVLVLGILSIALCWCYGIVGVVLGIIALVMSGKASALYTENPGKFSESSFKNMKAGKTCAIIGLCVSAAYLIFMVIYLSIVGFALTAFPWEMLKDFPQ